MELRAFIPLSVKVFEKEIYLAWNKIEGIKEYSISLKNTKEHELIKIHTSDPYAILDLSLPELRDEKSVTLEIETICGKSSDQYQIQHLSSGKRKKIEKIISSKIRLKRQVNAEYFIKLAKVYEENELLADALTAHIKAMEFSMDKKYRVLYNKFITRNKLDL